MKVAQSNIKDRIRELIEGKHGKINPRSASIAWWKAIGEEDIYLRLIEATSFITTGKSEYARRVFCFMHDLQREPVCSVCGTLTGYSPASKSYPATCRLHTFSVEIEEKRKKTMFEKYGYLKNFSSEEHRNSVALTNLEKYGTETPQGMFTDKVKSTCMEKYGVTSFTKTAEYRAAALATNNIKYGTNSHTQTDRYREKASTHGSHMYKGWRDVSGDIIVDYTNGMPKGEVAKKYGYSFSHINKIIIELGMDGDLPQNKTATPSFTSKAEVEIRDYLLRKVQDLRSNARNVIGEELDMYSPMGNVALEYNGDYWHSDKIRKKLHIVEKLEKCEKAGIQLLTIQEHLFTERKPILLKKIASAFGMLYGEPQVYARKTRFVEIGPTVANEFLEDNHVQGCKKKSPYNYGLYHSGELVAVATFKNFRDGVELVRFATNSRVVGGLSKLLKHVPFTNIYSFADRRYTYRNSNAYTKTGFVEIGVTPQSYVYVRGKNYLSRYQCMKHKLPILLKNFDMNLTEYENMSDHGFLRVWDCGHLLYQYMK